MSVTYALTDAARLLGGISIWTLRKHISRGNIEALTRRRTAEANSATDRSSKSKLEPILRESEQLERPRGRRKPGRPRIVASWFPQVAELMADGTTLKSALKRAGITLDAAQARAMYRNTEFRRMYQDARRSHELRPELTLDQLRNSRKRG